MLVHVHSRVMIVLGAFAERTLRTKRDNSI